MATVFLDLPPLLGTISSISESVLFAGSEVRVDLRRGFSWPAARRGGLLGSGSESESTDVCETGRKDGSSKPSVLVCTPPLWWLNLRGSCLTLYSPIRDGFCGQRKSIQSQFQLGTCLECVLLSLHRCE